MAMFGQCTFPRTLRRYLALDHETFVASLPQRKLSRTSPPRSGGSFHTIVILTNATTCRNSSSLAYGIVPFAASSLDTLYGALRLCALPLPAPGAISLSSVLRRLCLDLFPGAESRIAPKVSILLRFLVQGRCQPDILRWWMLCPCAYSQG